MKSHIGGTSLSFKGLFVDCLRILWIVNACLEIWSATVFLLSLSSSYDIMYVIRLLIIMCASLSQIGISYAAVIPRGHMGLARPEAGNGIYLLTWYRIAHVFYYRMFNTYLQIAFDFRTCEKWGETLGSLNITCNYTKVMPWASPHSTTRCR